MKKIGPMAAVFVFLDAKNKRCPRVRVLVRMHMRGTAYASAD